MAPKAFVLYLKKFEGLLIYVELLYSLFVENSCRVP